ncbi:Machado-Joseph disease protein MJD [Artemisia annua]|uniref:Machado-Joseph disease protein MJD n=1 Tax=Artemisia annua TaxID=35608 RepID=A0A2U1NRK8_ARTAN|nr:Machado-Joseph disease protein MJD [Artemisia annua]
MSSKLNSSKRLDGGRRGYMTPVRYLKHVGSWMVAVLCFVVPRKRGSTKVSSSGSPKQISRSQFDSQRVEAMKDCIEFINSSSSLTRSNSVSC